MLYVKIKNGNTAKTPGKYTTEDQKKEAVAHFRLMTGYDCHGEPLNRIGVLDTNISPVFKSGIMDSDRLLDCAGLHRVAQEQGNHLGLYWEARDLMD
ncbi:hypothetical protein NPIL_9881 [Nephila pilipes]|uniref:Uncharacterized protein n=1 Tax=Nephila pilipes TaxID=299642 RepID=A0A8X6IKV9_NEPPI|nr:hypothetical protein NPIL_9881 [Nephila pilipes]